jgi:hypothetical protein
VVEPITEEWIDERRARNYRRTPQLRIETPGAARAFVDEVGFCHFWPTKGTELPNLFQAIAGRVRPVPMQHDDPDMEKCWRWKDDALGTRQWYYGKLLCKRATLVSLEMLPLFYACSDNLGEVDDYLDEYRAGNMTAEAKWIYEALLEHGPLDTIQLRQKAGLSSSGAKSRFDRALVELQAGLKVLPVGVARAGRWKYAFTYEIMLRHFPDLGHSSRAIKRSVAQRALLLRYLENVVAADRAMIKRVFHVLKWTATELERSTSALLESGAVRETQTAGSATAQLVSNSAMQQGV